MKRLRQSVRGAAGRFGARRLFGIAAAASIAVMATIGIVVTADGARAAGAIATLNLWVDIAVGAFTMWGLYWAATEFAEASVRPSVEVVLVPPSSGDDTPAYELHPANWAYNISSVDRLPVFGMCNVASSYGLGGPSVQVGIALKNTSTRAARYIQIRLRMATAPAPEAAMLTRHFPAPSAEDEPQFYKGAVVSAQFAEDLVVYQTEAIVGIVEFAWSYEIPLEDLPRDLLVEYEVHALDGSSKGTVSVDNLVWRRFEVPIPGESPPIGPQQIPPDG